MSLLQTYDVKWPNSTRQVLTWSKIVNVGVGITAPDCVDYNWNFLLQYIVTMASPVWAVNPVSAQPCIGHNARLCTLLRIYSHPRLFWP